MGNKKIEFRVLVFAVALVSLASLLTNVGLANVFGSSKFGEYSYILLVGMVIGQIVVFGSDQYAVRFHFENAGRDVVSKIFVFRVLNFILISAVVMVWCVSKSEKILPYSLIVASQVLGAPYAYEISGKNIKFAVINIFEKFLYHSTIWIGIYFFETETFFFVFGVLLFWIIGSIMYQIIDRSLKPTSKSLPDKSMFVFGFWLLIFGLTKQMYGTGTRFFVEHNLGFGALGVYSLIWQVVPLVSTFLDQAVKSWRVRITESIVSLDIASLKTSIKEVFIATVMPVFVGAIVMNLIGGEVIRFIFSSEYESIPLLLPWLGLYAVIVALDVVVSIVWIAIGKIKIFNFLYLFFSVACFCFLYYFGGGLDLKEYLSSIVIFHGMTVLVCACITFGLLVVRIKEA